MGNYATTTTLDTLAVGITFDTATTQLAGICLTWSENEINKKLSTRYDVSSWIASTPPYVTSLSEQLALGYLYQQMSRGSKDSLQRSDNMIEKALKSLLEVAKGSTDLVNATGSIITERADHKTVLENTSNYYPTFAEDSTLNWKVDADKLDNIDSERD